MELLARDISTKSVAKREALSQADVLRDQIMEIEEKIDRYDAQGMGIYPLLQDLHEKSEALKGLERLLNRF